MLQCTGQTPKSLDVPWEQCLSCDAHLSCVLWCSSPAQQSQSFRTSERIFSQRRGWWAWLGGGLSTETVCPWLLACPAPQAWPGAAGTTLSPVLLWEAAVGALLPASQAYCAQRKGFCQREEGPESQRALCVCTHCSAWGSHFLPKQMRGQRKCKGLQSTPAAPADRLQDTSHQPPHEGTLWHPWEMRGVCGRALHSEM